MTAIGLDAERSAEAPAFNPRASSGGEGMWADSLARIGELSPELLDELCQTAAAAALERADGDEAELRFVAALLVERLYELVPSLAAERPLRRVALELKRDAHNARTPSERDGRLRALAARLDGRGRALLARYLELAVSRDRALGEAASLLAEELERGGRTLVSCLTGRSRLGLALASPSLAEELERGAAGGAPPPASSLGRSLTGYVTRSAVKTSPFGGLTSVSVPHASDAGCRASPVVTVAQLWLSACARHPDVIPCLEYEPAAGVRGRDGSPWLLSGTYWCVAEFPWRREYLVDASLVAPALAAAATLGRASGRRWLQELGGRRPHAALRRLVDAGVVRVVAPWHEPHEALSALAAAVATGRGPVCRELAAQLRASAAEVVRATGVTVPDRCEGRRALKRRLARSLDELGASAPAWLDDIGLVYEDTSGGPVEALPAEVRDDLQLLREHLGGTQFRTRLYDELRDRFVARHGVGASGVDLLGFLVDASTAPDFGAAMARVTQHDLTAFARGHGPREPVGASTAPPAAAVSFQVAAEDRGAVARGEHLLVVNAVADGLGGLVARFAPLLGEPLRRRLCAWLDRLFGDASPLQLEFATDFNGLLADAAGILPRLRWPGDQPRRGDEDSLDVARLTLDHDPARDALQMRDPDGRVVAPVYLGVVPQHLILGPFRLLLTLADPWSSAARIGDGTHPLLPQPRPPATVTATERHTVGRVVLRRARWRVPPGCFPIPGERESDRDYLRRALAWRRRHGLPTEVFARRELAGLQVDQATRKPRWLRFDSIYALRSFAATIAEDEPLALVEALPGRGQHPHLGPDRRPRATEWIAHMCWERP